MPVKSASIPEAHGAPDGPRDGRRGLLSGSRKYGGGDVNNTRLGCLAVRNCLRRRADFWRLCLRGNGFTRVSTAIGIRERKCARSAASKVLVLADLLSRWR